MAKGKYRVGGTKVIIFKKGSDLNGKRGVLLGEKDVIFGRKCFAVKLRGGIYMVNRDYVKVA